MEVMRTHSTTRVYIARLAGTAVFDPLGDQVGKVVDVVVLINLRSAPRAVGLVVEVPGRRRVFVPLSRVTAMEPGAVITTGVLNVRRFSQRSLETLVVGELLDKRVTLRDGSGTVEIRDVCIEKDRNHDWNVTRLFVQRPVTGRLGLRKGETFTVEVGDVIGLSLRPNEQGVSALLATMEDLKPADLADAIKYILSTLRLLSPKRSSILVPTTPVAPTIAKFAILTSPLHKYYLKNSIIFPIAYLTYLPNFIL